jgi:hypothetical protein
MMSRQEPYMITWVTQTASTLFRAQNVLTKSEFAANEDDTFDALRRISFEELSEKYQAVGYICRNEFALHSDAAMNGAEDAKNERLRRWSLGLWREHNPIYISMSIPRESYSVWEDSLKVGNPGWTINDIIEYVGKDLAKQAAVDKENRRVRNNIIFAGIPLIMCASLAWNFLVPVTYLLIKLPVSVAIGWGGARLMITQIEKSRVSL